MSDYIVSARKYRPQIFSEVVGQEHVTKTLENAVKEGHLAQSLLFCGPRGVGKTTTARILAREINNFEVDDKVHFNIVELDAASNNSVDDIRLLTEQVRYPPQQGKYKVYIIDEVHMLTTAAFNAFLKTLEEPPSYVVFILATTEKHKILPTILSRCQHYDFNRISVKDIKLQLERIAEKEKIEVEEEALVVIAEKADGALRDACSIFDLMVTYVNGEKLTYAQVLTNLHILDYDYFFQIITFLLNKDSAGTVRLFNEIITKGFNPLQFLSGFMSHLRDLFVCKDPTTIGLIEKTKQIQNKYLEQSQNCSVGFLLTCLDIANKFDSTYRNTDNKKLHIELALLKMAHITDAVSLVDLINNTEKKKTNPEDAALNNSQDTSSPVTPIVSMPKVPDYKEVAESVKEETINLEKEKETKQEKPKEIEYNHENVTQIWHEVIRQHTNSNPQANNSFLEGCYLKIESKSKISVFFTKQEVQKSQFDEIKPPLEEQIKKTFHLESISFEFNETEDNTTDTNVNSPAEKLEILVKKEPKIDDLFKQLDLSL